MPLEIIEVQIAPSQQLSNQNDLTSMHGNGKRNHNRFPLFAHRFAEKELTTF